MNTFFLGIVAFLIVLAVFDLVVGVSNDAVNFLNSAIGAKVAKFKTIVLVAAIGVFAGAAMSNGMMDVARHGIMTPEYFSFYVVMCVFLAVMVTDVVLLDIFNTLGMPTSTTVSMVFELLGGAFAIALIKILNGVTDASGVALTLGDLLNTEKALSVIMGIFLSVAIAFVLGTLVQWVARMVFSFTYRVNGTTTAAGNVKPHNLFTSSLKIGVFSGIAVTSIIWFLLINGLKGSSIMTPEAKAFINDYTWEILGGGVAVFSVLMSLLSLFKLPVLKFVVLLGTFALAMAFAGNDLVNFVGVPLTGLEAYGDFTANGAGDSHSFLMTSLMDSAQTPAIYLVLAGVVMVLSLVFSKKAQNVVKTSVDLSRQDEGDEMFGSSAVARVLVRTTQRTAATIAGFIPKKLGRWVDSRFNADDAVLADGAAFDLIRAAVNLVLAGLLVAIGTSMKLPLSTTYVTFMVAMGSSLADRAWSRESAVFRVTGVVSVIGGWFITAGAAFAACAIVCLLMHLGGFVVMLLFMALDIYLLWKSNRNYKRKMKEERNDDLFMLMMRTKDKDIVWDLLSKHVQRTQSFVAHFSIDLFNRIVDGISTENRRELKQCGNALKEEQDQLKKIRRKEMLAMRRIPSATAIERNTWFHIGANCNMQYIYCLKRMQEPLKEHVDNNFNPLPKVYTEGFETMRRKINELMLQTEQMISTGRYDLYQETLNIADQCKDELSVMRKDVFDRMQHEKLNNLKASLLYLNILQESQEFLSVMRHQLRAAKKFGE